jgi:hypothetical protein
MLFQTRSYGYGYVIVEVAGPKVTGIYMAEAAAGGPFVEVDRWVIADAEE